MGAPRACLIFITFHLVSLVYAQEIFKRMPQGFLGMRGKKYFDDEATEQFYKRKPQFFVGVKGKKTLREVLETPEEYYKRTPMGFMGMRGKKELMFPPEFNNEHYPKRDGYLIGQVDYTSSERPNDIDLTFLNDILMKYLTKVDRPDTITAANPQGEESESDQLMNEMSKRAAKMHQFFGVRGKKSMNNKRPYDLSFRGKFIGVRGKKDIKNNGPHEIKYLAHQNGPLPKRKAQMGFFGMRGKKSADESSPEIMDTPTYASSSTD